MHKIVNGKYIELTVEEESQILLEQKTNNIIQASRAYITKRQNAYPAIGDQLDMIWHAMNEGKLPNNNDFYHTIKEIKEQFPKTNVISEEGNV